jgi:coproporphyrinogen III oxidase
MLSKENISEYLQNLQNDICEALEKADGKGKFIEDLWERPEGGGGRTRILQNGNVIEKGGVLFSAVHGDTSADLRKQLKIEDETTQFFATGVSIVMHPVSPMVPIIHMNVRYFELSNGTCWFGGGIDLTPHYVVTEDARWFHQQLKNACDKHSPDYYPKFKNWADDYFFIKHRNETRGAGGIFYDYLKPQTPKGALIETQSKNDALHTKEDLFELMKSVGESFAPIYTHFMLKNKDLPFGEEEKRWQMLRRGRYVEFNLVWDRGTKFGLDTNGRTESILMSLPPVANWAYNYQPEKGSREEETLGLLRKGVDWLA